MSFTINDIDLDVVARNLVILLLIMLVEDPHQAVESAIHIWYSAFIRPTEAGLLANIISPMVENVCAKIANRGPKSLQAKTWKIGKCSLRLVLEKESWKALLSYFRAPSSLTLQKAKELRVAITRKYTSDKHRDLVVLQPHHRVSNDKFREDGLLLPFGHARDDFTIPNPQVLYSCLEIFYVTDSIPRTFWLRGDWPLNDLADPMRGWSFSEVLATKSGSASNDPFWQALCTRPLHAQQFQVSPAGTWRHL